MRSGIIGFILGVVMVGVALVVVQQRVIHDVTPDLSFHFDHYVFKGPEFPNGDVTPGRLVHRCLFPARYTITFYDAQYHEVTQADKPGRYGAVVRMHFGLGHEIDRFITLYRTPANVAWEATPWPMSVQMPDVGLDPVTLQTQQPEIGEMVKTSFVGDANVSPNLAILLAGLSETPPGDPPALARTNVVARNDHWWYVLRDRLGLAPEYPYLVYLPHDYDADPKKQWPMLLYVCTGAEKGSDLEKVRVSGLPIEIARGRQIPAVVICPQCPENEEWNTEALSHLIDEISAKYRIDPDRISVTGGGEVWSMGQAYPDRFSALLVLPGPCDTLDVAGLKDLPIWAFHDRTNESLPVGRTIEMIDNIRKAGGHPHLTISEENREVWNPVYTMDAVYTWLFAQKRGQPEVITPGLPTP